ncbi:hypothetical protein [Streptomyces hiroshimensis]|uniref:Uncharacterized protein n=1 Tax=Streptomyces hiroshimensis TaxID=66424 RepID=A0ABQ2Y7F2_9ACTN|nr:hypothetical protein [Streptomyces hiroshimensis]GGX68653.1 hypothetical protein GCM10010324_11810 [Streptomyces hiroshimensis]
MLTVATSLRSSNGSFASLDQMESPVPDPDYIEGALVVTVDGVEILSREHWDYVDQLWSYVVSMLEGLKESDSVATGFPDQPIEFKFSRKGARVLVQSVVNGRTLSALVGEGELLSAFRDAGGEFFRRMVELVPGAAAFYAMEEGRLLASC